MNAEQIVRRLELENQSLRNENGQLRNTLTMRDSHVRRIQQARDDALLLALWAAGGIPPSRRFALRQNMSERRWENACALLRMARVLTSNRRWLTRDASIIEKRLDHAAAAAVESEDAYKARHVRFRGD